MTLIWFVVVLGIIVFVHELGHFLVAKWCGVYVDCFSLGFGPRIAWLKIGETEYRISAIPLGGYIRMAGQFDIPEDIDKEAAKRYAHVPAYRRYDKQSVPRRMAIIAAGPLMNILFALPVAFLLLVTGQNQPLELDRTTIGNVIPGSPAAIAGLVPGDRILEIGGVPVRSWSDVVQQTLTRIGTKTTITYERQNNEITVPIEPGQNEELGYMGIGIARMMRAQIALIFSNTPASRSALQVGDVVDRLIGLNPSELSWSELDTEIKKRPNARLVLGVKRFPPVRYASESNIFETAKVLVETERAGRLAHIGIDAFSGMIVCDENTPTNFPVRTGDRIKLINGRRLDPEEIARYVQKLPVGDVHVVIERIEGGIAKTKTVTNVTLHVVDAGRIGVMFGEAQQRIVYRPIEAMKASPVRAWDKFVETLQVLRMLLERRLGLNAFVGPIGIARITGMAARSGFDVLLNIVLLITVNLGILNLLPLPVLDGGHLVLLAGEAVYRKPLPVRFVLWYQKAGFALIILLMGYVLYNDVIRWIIDNESLGLLIGRLLGQ